LVFYVNLFNSLFLIIVSGCRGCIIGLPKSVLIDTFNVKIQLCTVKTASKSSSVKFAVRPPNGYTSKKPAYSRQKRAWFLAWLTVRRNVPPKRWSTFTGSQGVISQKIRLLIYFVFAIMICFFLMELRKEFIY
jgi:hypothetical protein